MYYPHVLEVHQDLTRRPPSVGKLGIMRCFVRADSGIRDGYNRFSRDGKSVWTVLTPISTLALFRSAEYHADKDYNFVFRLPINEDGTLIYPPNPFHQEIRRRMTGGFEDRITIVEYTAHLSHISLVVETTDETLPILGDPLGSEF